MFTAIINDSIRIPILNYTLIAQSYPDGTFQRLNLIINPDLVNDCLQFVGTAVESIVIKDEENVTVYSDNGQIWHAIREIYQASGGNNPIMETRVSLE